MPRTHKRSDSASWQSTPDLPLPSSAKINPFKFMTRNVSWDPAIPNVTAEPTLRRKKHYSTPASYTSRDREPIRISPLHSLLAPETNAIFDARIQPATTVSPTSSAQAIAEPATASCARHLRIVSREFPWTIEVENPKQGAVTCADVFGALYAALSVPLTSSEWTLADDTKRESIQRANRNRRGGGSVRRLRRIDWLGSRVYFKGMSRDNGLERTRLLPEDDLSPDTWVVKFGSR